MPRILIINEYPDGFRGSAHLIADADIVIAFDGEGVREPRVIKDRVGDSTVVSA